MERGEGSHGNCRNPNSISDLNVDSSAANNTTTTTTTPRRYMREQDQYMPIANVIRIMRRILPPHAKISDDAKETMQECVSEYISFITSEANERCHREQRKTITAEDVLWAMGRLGFDNYIDPLTVFLNRHREAEAVRTSVRGEPSVKRTVDFGQGIYGAAAAAFPMPMGPHHQQGFLNAAAAAMNAETNTAAAMQRMNSYYRDDSAGAGGSSSQAPTANFDPFAQFK